MITCRHCSEQFPGALYDAQPNDCCHDCYHNKVGIYPRIWDKIQQSFNPSLSYKVLSIIIELAEEKLIKIKKEIS